MCMNSNSSLRILHISDLHFTSLPRKEEAYGRKTIPHDVLTEDVAKKFIRNFKDDFLKHYSEDQQPKIVIVSGDLVEQGGHDIGEFDRAREFLSELAFTLGIEKKRIFVVPGNHDVNWYKGVELENRFEDYFNVVEEFSSPELTRRGGLRIYHEDLSNVVQNISLEITLFISPTYSGIPDPTIKQIKQRVCELQEMLGENTISDDHFSLLDIAAIGSDQRSQMRPSSRRDNIDPVRIAVLHHHLLPDNQLEVSQFESVVDAGRMIDELISKKYDLVLTGHKHNRRLVHLKNKDRTGTIDIYTSPSLFKDEGRGFTIIDIHSPTSSYYATLHYYDYVCKELLPPQRLVREGRLLPSVIEVCSDIPLPDQESILLPILQSVKDYTHTARESILQEFYQEIWRQVSEDLRDIGDKRLVFRFPRIWDQWQNLISLTQNREQGIRLVSKNDLDYWMVAEVQFTEAYKYSEPLGRFKGRKIRILVLDRPRLTHDEEKEKCRRIILGMIRDGFEVAITPLKNIPANIMQDFGIIGDFSVSTFDGQEGFTRSLGESFNDEDLRNAELSWRILWQERIWDSTGNIDIEDFLDTYQY